MERNFCSVKSVKSKALWIAAAVIFAAGVFFFVGRPGSAQTTTEAGSPDELLAGFRHVEVASVSDAEEQILGKKMYMSHRMRPLFPTKFAGFALTVELKQQENKEGGAALAGMLAAIDNGKPNSVYVMVVQNGDDIAGMGGEMGTAMAAREFAGAVVDGGVRDTAYLTQIRFPVYGTGIVPSTSVDHYVFAGANIPVVCDGVPVSAGDVIVADSDGVVVVPRARAAEVLAMAQNMDFAEHSIDAYIMKYKSIEEAVKKFGRI
ncbi:MAG TPA: RraA family protein [Candidatus Aquilonibacter sp.]|nr:RraA family protein [Candidatus Aquilonibacter sp.]